MKTTKGPWSWDKLDGPNCKYAYLESAKECILEVTEETYLNNENLNLIAAAPELLKTLEDLLDNFLTPFNDVINVDFYKSERDQKEFTEEIKQALKLIKKAKGES